MKAIPNMRLISMEIMISDILSWWENDGAQNFTEYTIDDDFDMSTSVYATDLAIVS